MRIVTTVKKIHFPSVATLGVIAVLLFTPILGLALSSNNVSAASTNGFKAGDIIDNAVFRNNGSMSASQIQSFLNKKNSVCLKNYSGLALVDANGNGQVEDWTNAEQYGGKTGKAKMSAAQLIKAASDIYKINPQVFLVTLQKEQGLITGTNCANMGTAFGYGCPDTAACDTAAMGFTRQIDNAGYHFKGYYLDSLTYVPFTKGTYTINYNPKASCGGTKVVIENEATASLYSYTPYQPNKAALAAGYGTGNSCSAYGNRNFYLYFTEWFGSTHYTTGGAIGNKYTALGGAAGTLGAPQSNEKKLNSGVWQQFENGRIYWKSEKGAWVTAYGIGNKYTGIGGGASILGYPLGDEITLSTGGVRQQFENGRIYWKANKGTWVVTGGIGDKYASIGGDNGSLGYPISDEIPSSSAGVYQEYENGRIYWKSGTGGAHILRGSMLSYYLSNDGDKGSTGYPTSDASTNGSDTYQSFEHALIYKTPTQTYTSVGGIGDKYSISGSVAGILGAPQGDEVLLATGGVYQQFQNGRIYWKSKKGAWIVSGSLSASYFAKNADSGALGYPISDSKDLGNNNFSQRFEGGTLYKTSSGSHVTTGGIEDKYISNDGATGPLSLPQSDEKVLSDGRVYQQFEHGRIYWKSKKGAWIVAYAIGDKYINNEAATNTLGAPLNDEIHLSTGGVYQQFEHGRIYWKSKKGAWIVSGGIGSKYLALNADKSKLGYPLSNEVATSNGKVYQVYEHGKIYWTPHVGATVEYN